MKLTLPTGLHVCTPEALISGVDKIFWDPYSSNVGIAPAGPIIITTHWMLCGKSLESLTTKGGAHLAAKKVVTEAYRRTGRDRLDDGPWMWEQDKGFGEFPEGMGDFLQPGARVELDAIHPTSTELGDPGTAILSPDLDKPEFKFLRKDRRMVGNSSNREVFGADPMDVEVKVGLRYLLGFLTLGVRIWATADPHDPLVLSGEDGRVMCGLFMPFRMNEE